ncbi:aminotransferase class III-fold pyridoxal phosphate-dependent enzyme, partial [Mesorhizobium sp. M00.F.Ca.ET.149.01.1.1]
MPTRQSGRLRRGLWGPGDHSVASGQSGLSEFRTMTSHEQMRTSRLANERAKKVMPGGNTRSSVYEAPFPLYLKSGKGAYVTDVDDNAYLDFQNNFTALIHGYDHPEVNSALLTQIGMGLSFAFPTESEIDLAEILCERVPF